MRAIYQRRLGRPLQLVATPVKQGLPATVLDHEGSGGVVELSSLMPSGKAGLYSDSLP